MNRRVGYRFHPTDEELVDYFLKHKLNGVDFDYDDIRAIDICKFEPWDLPKYAAEESDDQVWYFFYRREKKYRSTTKPRYNRSTKAGHWKPTGQERPVKARRSRKEIGIKRTLVFYKFAEPKELRTNWVIHEYEHKACPPHQADLVLCKLKQKADYKADTSPCRVAESSHGGASDFEFHPDEISVSQVDPRLLLENLCSGRQVNFNQPCELQPHIQIEEGFPGLQQQIHLEEGVSIDDLMLSDEIFQNGSNGLMDESDEIHLEEGVTIDDLMLSDEIFQNGSNGLMDEFDTAELQLSADEMDDSFFAVPGEFTGEHAVFLPTEAPTRDPDGFDRQATASNAYTHRHNSSSPESISGVYLHEVCDMDPDDVYIRSPQFGVSKKQASSKGYRQMRSVQAITETLPPSRYEGSGKNYLNRDEIVVMQASPAESVVDRHEKINFIGRASRECLSNKLAVTNQPRSGNNKVEKKTTPGRNQSVDKLSSKSEPKAREAGTDLDQRRKYPDTSSVVKTERDRKMVTKTNGMTGNDKSCSSTYLKTSLLNQRSLPVSAYIINVFIGMVLFIAASRDLLILH